MKQENNEKKIKEGDLVSVPFGNKFLQGTVESINKESLVINNYSNGKVQIPNNDMVYKFFPGQKFDLRELNSIDTSSEMGTSIRQKLDAFLSKTSVGNFDSLMKNYPKQVGQLLAGKLTSQMFKGASLVTEENSEVKTKKEWAAKFQLYRGRDKNLKLDVKFQRPNLDLKVYGEPVNENEKKALIENKNTIVLDRKSKGGQDFKVFAKYDKDLNSIITFPYSSKIEERIKKAQDKKKDQGLTKVQEKSNSLKTEGLKPAKTAKSKGRSI